MQEVELDDHVDPQEDPYQQAKLDAQQATDEGNFPGEMIVVHCALSPSQTTCPDEERVAWCSFGRV
jgi:hypothetical protein